MDLHIRKYFALYDFAAENVTDFENVTNLAREISKLFKNLINEEFWLIQTDLLQIQKYAIF